MKTPPCSVGVTLNVTPFFDNGCSFQKLQMYEEIGGTLARGELYMLLDGSEASLNIANEQYTGHITLEKDKDGNIYEVDFFITSRVILNNTFQISFVCVPTREFFTDLHTKTFDDITSAINSLYSPGKVDIRCESDVCNGIEFYQQRETDHEFCSRLCSSFKHDIVFGFGWEGLMMKETIGKDHFGNDEPYYTVWANQEVSQITDYILPYNNLLYQAPLNPWEENEDEATGETLSDNTGYESKNCCCMRTYDEYRIMGRDYYQALENRRFNLRYLDSSLFSNLVIVDTNMPDWKLGDVIYYKRRWSENNTNLPYDVFLVKSNEVFFAADSTPYTDQNGLKFSWTTKLLGLTQEGVELNREDPSNASSSES